MTKQALPTAYQATRVDVETETDCIEIARLHGYDNILPALVSRVNLSGEQTKRFCPLPERTQRLSVQMDSRIL